MAKRTAVVDLGSNSVRLVIFEKTSRYAFHILSEYKRKVRLGENAYNNGKILQPEAMKRTENTLAYFKEVALKYKCSKMLIVGTSALRDAPNSKDFIKRVQKNLKLNIRCIDGRTESYLGGLAAINLLSNVKNATTLDIGGGSSELCLIENGKIKDFISLDLGTVRLKELFYDRGKFKELESFLEPVLKSIPKHFKNDKLIAIGGSLRAISSSIMQKNSYPLKTLHEFSYDLEKESSHIKKILNADTNFLLDCGIKKDRFDTIKEGTLIFLKIAQKLGVKEVITSGVGVREGVFLNDILPANKKFPANFNASIRSLQDRFLGKEKSKIARFAKDIFESLQKMHGLNDEYKNTLITAAKLCNVGCALNFYFANEHGAYFVLNALNYNFSHQQRALIAILIKLNGRKINSYSLDFKELLPENSITSWLNFILALAKILAQNHLSEEKINFELSKKTLFISCEKSLDIPKDELKKIFLPSALSLVLNQKST